MANKPIFKVSINSEIVDLISRADALKKWDDLSERGRTEFDQVLMTLPSADRPSIVRCKDCKHYIVEGITTQYGWCHEYKHSVDEDDYCSYGERKEE